MNGLKQYENEVSGLLDCPQEEKEYYLKGIRESFAPFTDQMTYEQLVKKLGTPEEWVNSLLNITDGQLYVEEIRKKTKRKRILRLFAALAIVLVIGTIAYFIWWNERTRSFEGAYGEIVIDSLETDERN
ncbi:MAG: hypothetical protein J5493_05675 [Lachnospiraceae bacterium]|nr:hypothetical protein [Lachnospiraceae bacterium]